MFPVVEFKVVMVPLVDQKLVAVKLVEEALSVYVVVATVRFPAKNPLPFTERSWPGVVVPMPTLPSDCILIRSVPVTVVLLAAVKNLREVTAFPYTLLPPTERILSVPSESPINKDTGSS